MEVPYTLYPSGRADVIKGLENLIIRVIFCAVGRMDISTGKMEFGGFDELESGMSSPGITRAGTRAVQNLKGTVKLRNYNNNKINAIVKKQTK